MAKRKKGTYQRGNSSRKHDVQKKAKTPGKRKSSGGKVYYERRKNRSDMPGSLTGLPIKVILKKYPKKPKANATTMQLAKYKAKVEAIDNDNANRLTLSKQIGKIVNR